VCESSQRLQISERENAEISAFLQTPPPPPTPPHLLASDPWLRDNRICPLCRFDVSTTDDRGRGSRQTDVAQAQSAPALPPPPLPIPPPPPVTALSPSPIVSQTDILNSQTTLLDTTATTTTTASIPTASINSITAAADAAVDGVVPILSTRPYLGVPSLTQNAPPPM
jgi:hypothetical protein